MMNLETELQNYKNATEYYRNENKRLREALETITRRKMSCYASTEHMNRDFIKIARQALEGDSIANRPAD